MSGHFCHTCLGCCRLGGVRCPACGGSGYEPPPTKDVPPPRRNPKPDATEPEQPRDRYAEAERMMGDDSE